VQLLFEEEGLKEAVLVGHSMGAKLAMLMALHHPSYVEKLVIIDAAPAVYSHSHAHIFEAMERLPLGQIKTRHHADEWLAHALPALPKSVRSYLLENLQRLHPGKHEDDVTFRWRVNLAVLQRDQHLVQGFPFLDTSHHHSENKQTRKFDRPTLFIGATDSGRMTTENINRIEDYFSNYQLRMLPGGHFIHFEHPHEFNNLLYNFVFS
jgi:esterase